MKMVGYAYLDYPDDVPDDPTNAATLMYVNIEHEGREGASDTYAVTVYTYKYLQENYAGKGHVLAIDNFLLVPTIDDGWMKEYLKNNAAEIVRVGDVR